MRWPPSSCVTDSYDRIRSQCFGLSDHVVRRLLARIVHEFGVLRHLSTQDVPEERSDVEHHATHSYRAAFDHSTYLNYFSSTNFVTTYNDHVPVHLLFPDIDAIRSGVARQHI